MKKKKPARARKSRKPKNPDQYTMHLYVTGATPRSSAAVTNLRKLCEQYLPGRYELRVIDIYQQPELAAEGHVIAAPTLVKSFPLPLRRFIGDMSHTDALLAGLEIHSGAGAEPEQKRRKA